MDSVKFNTPFPRYNKGLTINDSSDSLFGTPSCHLPLSGTVPCSPGVASVGVVTCPHLTDLHHLEFTSFAWKTPFQIDESLRKRRQ